MGEIKTVLIVAALPLAATGFCLCQVNSEKKVGHHSEIKSESRCEKEYKKYCLNGGDYSYPVDENIIAWRFSGGKRCEKYKCWT